MADRIKGITIEIGGDTTGLSKALSGVNKEIKSTQSQLKDVERLLKLDPSNTELLSQKQKLLTQAVADTKEKLDTLKAAESQVQQQFAEGKINQQQYDALKREIIETSEQLKALEKQAGDASVAMQKLSLIGDKFQEVGGKISGVGEKMLPVTAAITGLGAASVAAAMSLDDGYDTIIKKTGATGEALDDLNKAAENVFTSLPTTMDDAGAAVGEINTRFGLTGTALEDLSAKFIKFAQINDADVNQSVQLVSRAMGDAGISADKAGEFMDQLTVAAQMSGISIETLTENVTKYGAPMRALGFDTKESISIFAAWEKAGVNTEIAFSGMKKAIGTWGKEGKDARVEFKKTLDEIGKAPNIADATTKAIEVFGQKAGPDLADAIQGGRFAYDDFLKALESSSGVVEKTFESTLDPWDDATIAANNLKLAGADLGNTLLQTLVPIIKSVVEKVKEFTTWFRNLDQAQKETIIKVAAIVAAIGPLLIIIGKLATAISAIIKAYTAISGVITTITTAFGAGGAAATGFAATLSAIAAPVTIIIATVAALIAIFVTLYKNNEDFRNKVNELWGEIKNTISGIIEVIKQIISDFVTITKQLWSVYGDDIMKVVSAAFDFIGNIIVTVITYIKDTLNVFLALIKGDWSGAWEAMQTLLTNVFNNFNTIIDSALTVIKNVIDLGLRVVSDIFNAFKDKAIEIFNILREKIAEKAVEIKDSVVNGITLAIDWIKELPEKARQWGTDFIDGLVQGIKDKVSAVTDAIKGVADTITSYIHFSRPDIGPLREYEKWMPDMITGLANGIKRNAWKLTDQLNGLTGNMSYILTGDTTGNSADLSKIENMLGYYLPSLNGGSNIVLDDGTLVGRMMPNIDSGLTGYKETAGRAGT